MLIIANGAFKSGSTWLYNILKVMTGFPPPPDKYLNPDWVNPSIDPQKLESTLSDLDYHSNNYIVKNHFDRTWQRNLLLKYEDVYVLDIQRELSDVVVSAYHHNKNKHDFNKSFMFYYWRYGRFTAMNVKKYHELWDPNRSPDKIYMSSFEKLKKEFNQECKDLGLFIGKNLSFDAIRNIYNETSIDTLRKKYDDQDFFRKGKVGYKDEYFSKLMEKDIEMIKSGNINCSSNLSQKKEKVKSLFYGFLDYLKI
jgi:hypothetical protein